ncbi:hypothetical protein OPFAMLBM_00103 [Aeromonas phage avDM12-TAAL]|nr:hypothetical protein OPFAMLBM_00103 [Aeromonas phage avDM12-TAAL]
MNKVYDKAVVNGRYQINHIGHLEMIRVAMSVAKKVYIILGSANAYPNMKNPFRPAEREAMLRIGMKDYGLDPNKVNFRYVDDSNYTNERWQADIRDAVDEQMGDKITMVGNKKDKNSWWLETFGWELTEIDCQMHNGKPISATFIRDSFFDPEFDFTSLHSEIVTPGVIEWLKSYKIKKSEEYDRLAKEHQHNIKELKKMEAYPYREALNCSTGDAVVTCNGHLLVTIRGNMPGLGAYALPGGHKNEDETYKECAIRELREEVRLKVPERVIRGSVKKEKIFDYPGRSYPICKPTLALYIELQPDNDGKLPAVKPRDEVRDVFWMPMHMVRRNRHNFFDDHYEVIQHFTGI